MRSTPFEDAPDAEDVIDDHFEESEAGDGSETEADDASGADERGDGEADAGSSDAEAAPEDDQDRDPGERGEGESADEPGETSSGDEGRQTDSTDGEPAPTPKAGNGSDPAGADDADARETEGNDGASESDDTERATPLVPGRSTEPVDGAAAPELDTPAVEDGSGDGRAKSKRSTRNGGVRVRTEPADPSGGVDAAASVRAAAARGRDRVETRDLRRSVRSGAGEALVVFAVDASASMRPAMAAAKGVVLELLEGSYAERDSVAVVAFAGEDAEVLLPPTDSVALAARHLKTLPTGDRTPLPAGLRTTARVIDRAEPESAVAVVVSDGRANAGASPTAETRDAAAALASTGARVVCVEAGEGRGLLADVASAADGSVVPLEALTAARVERELGESR
jgi:magnesium chelatase subunit D